MVGYFVYLVEFCLRKVEESKEGLIPSVDESRVKETKEFNKTGMDLGRNGVESECKFEFWPIQHPIEPLDEDRPVKCPPISDTYLAYDGKMQEERISDNWLKRAELSVVVHKEEMVIVAAAETPARADRKRHHTLTHEDLTVTPLLRMPPIYPYTVPQCTTIFDMMQHFNKFES